MKSEFSCIFPKIQGVPYWALVRNGESFLTDPLSKFTHLCSSYSFAGVGIQVQNCCGKRLLLHFSWQTYNLGVSKILSESLFSWESCPDFQQIWNIIQGSVETYTITQLQQSSWLSFFDVAWLCLVYGFVGFLFWLLGWFFFFGCYSSFVT